jgi:hypothetical protein
MLERYYIRPITVDRIRTSWIAPAIEQYVGWLAEQRYSSKTVSRRIHAALVFLLGERWFKEKHLGLMQEPSDGIAAPPELVEHVTGNYEPSLRRNGSAKWVEDGGRLDARVEARRVEGLAVEVGGGLHPGEGRPEEPLGRAGGVLRVLDLREQDQEFIATLAAHGVGAAYTSHRALCDRLKQLIARRMPQGVIDMFEAIQIDNQQGYRVSFARGARQLGFELRDDRFVFFFCKEHGLVSVHVFV